MGAKLQLFKECEHFLVVNSTSPGRLIIVVDFNFHWENASNLDTVIMSDMLMTYYQ